MTPPPFHPKKLYNIEHRIPPTPAPALKEGDMVTKGATTEGAAGPTQIVRT
jgi:hypothetical protein